ncbi:MAG: hypothetical protein PQJ45_11830 [Sphaerochaetaceae bacterium]|nr:hypothetical protein [Sphaerochaetaceae bacterium]MDC7238448.1 hypothetical protein [Sphaerochaetaceae bacterium]
MLNKKNILTLFILLTINLNIFASLGLDVGLNYNSSEVDSDGNTVDSEYPFSLVALPSFSANKFSIELNTPIYFKVNDGAVEFDYSNYLLPEEQDEFLDSAYVYSKFFLSFINYAQWASFNEDFAIRIGKITNSTIGDGALLYHFEDENVGEFETRAGLQFKFDANMVNLPFGFELIATDMFDPDLFGARVFFEPIFFLGNDFLNKLTLGYTVTYNTEYADSSSEYWLNIAYDLQLPLFKTVDNSMILYYDLISEAEIDDSTDNLVRELSQRVGVYGWYFTDLTYDAHIQNIIDDDASEYTFGNSNWDLVSKTLLPQFKKDFVISANTGYYSNNGMSEFTLGSEIEFDNLKLDNYDLTLEFISTKAIGPISDISASVTKSYYIDSSTDELTEDFITGLTSTKNLEVDLSANIIFYQVNAITVSISIEGDESGNIDPTYSFGYKLSLL